jgi:hypothetical protein
MAGESDDPENAASRLEAALERIAAASARHAASVRAEVQNAAAPSVAPPDITSPQIAHPEIAPRTAIDPQVAARLDGLIDRLRGALAARPG